MSWLILRDDQFKFKTLGKSLLILGEYMKLILRFRKIERNQHVTSWNSKHLDLDWFCSKSPCPLIAAKYCHAGPICCWCHLSWKRTLQILLPLNVCINHLDYWFLSSDLHVMNEGWMSSPSLSWYLSIDLPMCKLPFFSMDYYFVLTAFSVNIQCQLWSLPMCHQQIGPLLRAFIYEWCPCGVMVPSVDRNSRNFQHYVSILCWDPLDGLHSCMLVGRMWGSLPEQMCNMTLHNNWESIHDSFN